jgi:N-acetylglucosamine-6-phosphate deacetylase
MTLKAITAARLFTGESFADNQALIVEGDTIRAVVARSEIPASMAVTTLEGGVVAPGFIDLQVNGGGGVLFNETPTAEALERLAAAHARFGTTAMLPTFITDRPEGMAKAIGAVREAMARAAPGIVGIHLEGPFLARSRKGAHDPALIRPMTEEDIATIVGCGLESVLLTVAPETVPAPVITRLAQGGVTVSLGHTDAGYELAMAAADAGARGITHLFNAMSQLQHRAPGVVGAALDHGALWCGIVADGHHVHPAALRSALRAKKGPARLFLVTDAMPTAGDEGDVFFLNGRKVTRHDGLLTLEDGTLAGSDLTMDRALRYAVDEIGVGFGEALRMASLYPAMLLSQDQRRGRLAPGYRADLVHLDAALGVKGVWIGGKRSHP